MYRGGNKWKYGKSECFMFVQSKINKKGVTKLHNTV